MARAAFLNLKQYYSVWDIPHLLPRSGSSPVHLCAAPSGWSIIEKLAIVIAFLLLVLPLTWKQENVERDRMRHQITLTVAVLSGLILLAEIIG